MNYYLKFALLLLLSNTGSVNGQNSLRVSFNETEREASRDKKKDNVLRFVLKAPEITNPETYSYTIIVEPDLSATTINQSEYTLDFKPQVVTNQHPLGETAFYLILKPDSVPDRAREIKLKIKIVDGNNNDISPSNKDQQALTIKIKSIETAKEDGLKRYAYLAYIGTNFDLVDGIKAKNLFFATNIYLPNVKFKTGVGAFISLYGNRTLTATDSSGQITRPAKIERSSDTTATYYNESAKRVTSYFSDNIGAYFSPLINLGSLSKKENNLKIYYSPSAEFIWRRTQVTTTFTERTPTDTVVKKEQINGSVVIPDRFKNSFNQYQFNVGAIGFFLTHEHENISIRLYCAVGYSSRFMPAVVSSSQLPFDTHYRKLEDIFFSGRLWITEPVSGLTLQAEITNTLKTPAPYYGVTLSKAIDFKHLGNVFSPVGR